MPPKRKLRSWTSFTISPKKQAAELPNSSPDARAGSSQTGYSPPPSGTLVDTKGVNDELWHEWKFTQDELEAAYHALESPPFVLAGIPWAMKARAETREGVDVFFVVLSCLYEDKAVPWEIDQCSTITLRHRTIEKDNVAFKFDVAYSNNASSWSSYATADYREVTNKDRGYFFKGELVLELQMKVKTIAGVTQTEPISFEEPGEGSDDVVLVVEDQKLHVSRNLLSTHSPYFTALFFRNFKEQGKDEIPLPDVSYKDFVELLYVIYPCYSQINHVSVHSILRLADRFDVKYATHRAERYLLETLRVDVSSKLLLSDQYRLTSLQRTLLQTLTSVEHVKGIEKQPSFKKFSLELRSALLSRVLEVTKPETSS